MGLHKIDVCAGGLWHLPSLSRGLAELGFSVRIVSTAPEPANLGWEYVRVGGLWQAQRMTRRMQLESSHLNRLTSQRLARRLREDSFVIAWSSFASGIIDRGREVVVVRGSHHIQRQRDILSEAERTTGVPTPKPSLGDVALERSEYHAAKFVSVPSLRVFQDDYWCKDRAEVRRHPLGFPDVQGLHNRSRGRSRTACFVGGIGVRKGVDYLARAFSQQQGDVIHVEMVGKQESGFPMRLLPSWWTLHGQLPYSDVLRIVSQADVMVLLSREEGQIRAGMESLALGTPILVTEETGLGDFIRDGGGVVVPDPNDVDVVRDCYRTLLRDWPAHSLRACEVAASWSWRDHAVAFASDCGLLA